MKDTFTVSSSFSLGDQIYQVDLRFCYISTVTVYTLVGFRPRITYPTVITSIRLLSLASLREVMEDVHTIYAASEEEYGTLQQTRLITSRHVLVFGI